MASVTNIAPNPTNPRGLTPKRIRQIKEAVLGYGFLAPTIILLIIFEFYPVLFGFYISMCDWKLTCKSMVGFDNYVRAFADPDMWHSLLVTATYSLISVPVQLGLGLVLAYLLFQKIKGLWLYRMMFFMPYITTTVASAAVWAYLYSPDIGPINKLLGSLGIEPLRWLGETRGIFDMMLSPAGVTLPEWAAGPSLALFTPPGFL
jgi:multiple sugar transport system permease protein